MCFCHIAFIMKELKCCVISNCCFRSAACLAEKIHQFDFYCSACINQCILLWARKLLMSYLRYCFPKELIFSMQDILKWPRPPSPPVIRLDEAYETEYGMPSTHTMCAVTAPFSLLLFVSQMHKVRPQKYILYILHKCWKNTNIAI